MGSYQCQVASFGKCFCFDTGDTALIVASTKGHQGVVQTLLQANCDFMLRNRWGRNALHEACSVWSGPPDTVELLLLANMCPDVQVCTQINIITMAY